MCFVYTSEYHEFSYRGIDHYEIQYAIIGEYAKADQFITFDRWYEYIKEDFPSLSIQILDSTTKIRDRLKVHSLFTF